MTASAGPSSSGEELRGPYRESSAAIMAVVDQVRIDKWLWAARFLQDAQRGDRGASSAGAYMSTGERVKPSKVVEVFEPKGVGHAEAIIPSPRRHVPTDLAGTGSRSLESALTDLAQQCVSRAH
jgi:hypothetical protein